MITDYESTDRIKNECDDLQIIQNRKNGGRLDEKNLGDEEDEKDQHYKSKNLKAERRRRKKLSDRQLELRALMNKATIITDAITYIEELKKNVERLSNQLHQVEATRIKDEKPNFEEFESPKKWGIIHPEVQVIGIDGKNLWIKIMFQKKRGALTKVMEAMSLVGIDLTYTTITTDRGAILLTSSVEDIHGRLPDATHVQEFLLEAIRRI